MHPCAVILSQKPVLSQKTFSGVSRLANLFFLVQRMAGTHGTVIFTFQVPPHDTHNIQTHDISISMLVSIVPSEFTASPAFFFSYLSFFLISFVLSFHVFLVA